MGDVSGMQRLFQEICDPQRVAALDRAQGFLDQERVNWQEMYLATATPGREYSGQVGLSSPEVVVMRSGGDVIVAQTRDVALEGGLPSGTVHFTATDYGSPEQDGEGQGRIRQIDLDL